VVAAVAEVSMVVLVPVLLQLRLLRGASAAAAGVTSAGLWTVLILLEATNSCIKPCRGVTLQYRYVQYVQYVMVMGYRYDVKYQYIKVVQNSSYLELLWCYRLEPTNRAI